MCQRIRNLINPSEIWDTHIDYEYMEEDRQSMVNNMERKTNIEHTTLYWKLKLEKHKPYEHHGTFRCPGKGK